mgnify:FL=1
MPVTLRNAALLAALLALMGCKKADNADKRTQSAEPPKAQQRSAHAQTKTLRVGVLYWSMNILGQVAMREGLELSLAPINAARRAEHLREIELVARVAGDGTAGIERQVAQMRELLASDVDLIVVQPADTAALSKVLQAANKKGIPVVAYDQHVLQGELASFITSDNYQAGYLNGEYVAAKFPDDKRLQIVVVEYPHVSSTVSRVDGFADALEATGQPFDFVKSYSAIEPVAGAIAGKAILRDFPAPGSIDVVFTVNDGGGLAVFNELEGAGRTEIFGATVDGAPASVAQIREGGIIRIDSAQFCGELGATALRTADALLRGRNVGRQLLVPVFPITAETEKQYKGWVGEVPASFTKPWASEQPMWSPEIRPRGDGRAK